MVVNLTVIVILVVIVGYAAYKSIVSMKNNSCPGCSGGCSVQQKNKCQSVHDNMKNKA